MFKCLHKKEAKMLLVLLKLCPKYKVCSIFTFNEKISLVQNNFIDITVLSLFVLCLFFLEGENKRKGMEMLINYTYSSVLSIKIWF